MIRLAIRVRRGHAELVLAELLELAPSGVEEVADGEVVEYAVYGAPGELPALPALRAAAGGALVEISTSEIADDWGERWRAFHRPVVVGDRLTVRPPWEPPAATPLEVVIDPGQAFGTGAHASTRLCLELLLSLDGGGSFVDLGCGSGVLAIAAARLGFAPVLALDNDPAAIEATRANAAVERGRSSRCGASICALSSVPGSATPSPPTCSRRCSSAGRLRLWAHWVAAQDHRRRAAFGGGRRVARAFAGAGLRETARLDSEGWAALLLE